MKESLKLFFSFIALCFGLNFVYFGLLSKIIDLRILVANLVAKTLHTFLWWNTSVDGLTIMINGEGAINVINECTGIFSMTIFAAIVLAYDTSFRNKIVGLVVGVPILFSLAIIRLSLTTLTAVKYPEMLHLIHDYLFQIFLLIFVVVLFILWHDVVIEKKHNIRRYTVLFGEFVVLTTVLFLVWTQIAIYYANFILMTTALLLSNISINYSESQMFLLGMVTTIPSYISLLVVTPAKWKNKLCFFGIGLGLIFIYRIFLGILYVFSQYNQNLFGDFLLSFFFGPVRVALPLCIWGIFVYHSQKHVFLPKLQSD